MQVGIGRLPALEGLAEGLVVVGDAAVDGAGGGGPPAQDAQQRRLAAAGRAHQRQHLAGGRRPGYPSQYLPRRALPRHPVLHLRKLPRTPPLRYEAFPLRDVHAWRCVLSIVFYLEVYRQGRLGHQFLAPCPGFDVHCCGRAGRIYIHAYATVVRAG